MTDIGDPIKKRYDEIVRDAVRELHALERDARACSEVAGYRNGIAMRMQADIVETLRVTLEKLIAAGGLPSLSKIDEIINYPVTMVVPAATDDEIAYKLQRWRDGK
jgi:hypothetical protein